jgi:hypothetical protein
VAAQCHHASSNHYLNFVAQKRKSVAKAAATVAAAQLAEIESDLATNLVRRKEELEAKLTTASADEDR